MAKIVIHPLIEHKLTLMRDEKTSTARFRMLAKEISMLLVYEVTSDLSIEKVDIKTPLTTTRSNILRGPKLVLAPILRAGTGMLEGMLEIIPHARIAHIGIFRDENTFEAKSYFFKSPEKLPERRIIVLDPMLATGGSAVSAISQLKDHGARDIDFVCILAAPEGIKRLETAHPDVRIVTCAIDQKLNDKGYIVPGLGDAGDRIYGTR